MQGAHMGPEAAEIVARIEEEFSLDLPDSDLATALTVGDLYQIVLDVLAAHVGSSCPACKAFHRIRAALSGVLGVPKGSIRHATRLEPLLPTPTRRAQWSAIANRIEGRFPALELTEQQRIWDRILLIAIPTTVIAVFWSAASFLHWLPRSGFVFPLLALFLWLLIMLATRFALRRILRRLALGLPAETAGDLTRLVLILNFETIAAHGDPHEPLKNHAVWERIVPIVAEQLQMDPHAVLPGTHLQVNQPVKSAAL